MRWDNEKNMAMLMIKFVGLTLEFSFRMVEVQWPTSYNLKSLKLLYQCPDFCWLRPRTAKVVGIQMKEMYKNVCTKKFVLDNSFSFTLSRRICCKLLATSEADIVLSSLPRRRLILFYPLNFYLRTVSKYFNSIVSFLIDHPPQIIDDISIPESPTIFHEIVSYLSSPFEYIMEE